MGCIPCHLSVIFVVDRSLLDHGKENPMRKFKNLPMFLAAATLGLTLAAGCATSSIPSAQKISQSDRAIHDAQFGNASVSAPDELKSAEEKLARAKQAQANRDYEQAILLAEQAFVDAEYARAKATLEKTKKAVDEIQKKTKALREDLERLSRY
jgi:hypothetical protein